MRHHPHVRARRLVHALTLVAIIAAGAWPSARASTPSGRPGDARSAPDLILFDGKAFTADPGKPWAKAVAIHGNRIEAVGSDQAIEALAGPTTRRIDLHGRVVLPGLTDAHVHPAPDLDSLLLRMPRDAGLDPSVDAVEGALAQAVKQAADGRLIEGVIGPTVLQDASVDRAWLDRRAPHNPVLLWGFTGHGLIANSAALRYVGIAPHAANPPGGWYGRVGHTQRLNGRIYEYAIWKVDHALFAKLPTSALAAAYRKFAEERAAWGVTTVQTMGTDVPVDRLVAALDQAGPPIRFEIYRRYLPVHDVAEAWAHPLPTPRSPRVKVVGSKWILDGTPVEWGAYMRQPYADRPGERGRLDWSPGDIRQILAHALASGEPVALHMTGDGTAAVVFAQMHALAPDNVWREKRLVRIEHGDGLAPDLLKEAVALGAVLTQNPTHFADPAMLRARFGADRMKQMQPLASALRAGMHLALGSDQNMGPAANPWLNIMLAVIDPAHPGEALTREQAIEAYTAGGAYVSGEEDQRGKLAPGMLADVAVLSADPFTIPLHQLPGVKSVLTLVGGKVVHDGGLLHGQ